MITQGFGTSSLLLWGLGAALEAGRIFWAELRARLNLNVKLEVK